MGKGSLERELQELRKQVDILANREQRRREVEEQQTNGGLQEGQEELSHLPSKLADFLGALHKDLREIPLTTAVGVFALGVVIGRLLPR